MDRHPRRLILWANPAFLAVVTHPVDVGTGGGIGLGGHDPPIRKLRHSHHIGGGHPVDGIHIIGEEPVIDFSRSHPMKQRVQTNDHQTLDVVAVSGVEYLFEAGTHTGHLRLSRPKKSGNGRSASRKFISRYSGMRR